MNKEIQIKNIRIRDNQELYINHKPWYLDQGEHAIFDLVYDGETYGLIERVRKDLRYWDYSLVVSDKPYIESYEIREIFGEDVDLEEGYKMIVDALNNALHNRYQPTERNEFIDDEGNGVDNDE